jgi:hypothetical protein
VGSHSVEVAEAEADELPEAVEVAEAEAIELPQAVEVEVTEAEAGELPKWGWLADQHQVRPASTNSCAPAAVLQADAGDGARAAEAGETAGSARGSG